MAETIDFEVLRGILADIQAMADYYAKGNEKVRQNEALKAAGLAPLHSESSLQWEVNQGAKKRDQVACLTAVIALLGGAAQAEAA